jgi:hypothetical protein
MVKDSSKQNSRVLPVITEQPFHSSHVKKWNSHFGHSPWVVNLVSMIQTDLCKHLQNDFNLIKNLNDHVRLKKTMMLLFSRFFLIFVFVVILRLRRTRIGAAWGRWIAARTSTSGATAIWIITTYWINNNTKKT